MGSQSRKLSALVGVLAVVGCNSSVELPEQPASAPPAAVVDSTPAPVAEQPARVEMSESAKQSEPPRGYLGAVAGGYRSAREQLESLGVTQAIQHYHASTGEYPKSHEEFMKKVWEPLQTPFPEIEEGYKYEYDPTDHMVYKVLIEEEAVAPE